MGDDRGVVRETHSHVVDRGEEGEGFFHFFEVSDLAKEELLLSSSEGSRRGLDGGKERPKR
jgi:hypothetical protein